jgi:hypothetical protein
MLAYNGMLSLTIFTRFSVTRFTSSQQLDTTWPLATTKQILSR